MKSRLQLTAQSFVVGIIAPLVVLLDLIKKFFGARPIRLLHWFLIVNYLIHDTPPMDLANFCDRDWRNEAVDKGFYSLLEE